MSLSPILSTSTGGSAPVNFTGLSSNIDTNSIIQEILRIDALPIQQLQTQQDSLNTELQALQDFGTKLGALGTAANSLNSSAAFNPITATSSDQTVATITATSNANAGSYSLSITKVAQAEKISSAAQADTTSALNLTGTLVINGKGVQIGGSDSLTTIAQKINGLSAGVTAGVINGGSGAAYLSLTANSTGAASKIQIADLQGNVASSLGLISGSDSIRQPITGGAASYTFSSQTTNLATLLNGNNLGSQTFHLNGVAVTFDPNNTTLQGLVTAINAANTGATASIQTGTNSSGGTSYQLNITGLSGQTDDTGFLKGIGILQTAYGHEVLGAQDAAFTLDNANLTSPSNTVTNVISGATIQLLKGTTATPGTTNLTLSQDSSAVTKSVQAFVDAYNGLQSFVSQNSQLDPKTYATGPLFSNSTVQQVQQQLVTSLFNTIPGLQPPYNNLAAVGMGLDQNGNLTFDSTKLQTALQQNPSAVATLFKAAGTGSSSAISFVSNTNKTVASGSGSYALNITQAATEGVYTASTAQTQNLAANELLTFNGALFGNTAYTLLLQAGESQAAVVSQINADATLKNLVTASVQNGKLTITSKKFGGNGNFSLTSDTAASSSSSGIRGGAFVAGLDLAGTINGEAATGNGQFLTGNAGNATTDGLQVSYTGSATGQVGSVTFNKGIGAFMNDLVTAYQDPANGLLTTSEKSLQTEITDITTQMTDLQAQLVQTQAQLQQEFTAMETAMSQLQSQQKQFAAASKSSTG